MASVMMLPYKAMCSEEKKEEKGILSILDFSKKEKSQDATVPQTETADPHQQMLKSADEGDLDAQLALGYLFLYGNETIEPDYAKAFHYYKLAAEQNNNIAINNLGSLYYSGIGTSADVGKAMDLFEKAYKLGNMEAAVNLAFLYMTDNPRAKDSYKAILLFEDAANLNNPTAQFMLGYAYLHGFIKEKDYTKAFDLMQKSAIAKYDEAQYQTGLMYMDGKGTPQNYGKAVAFLDAAVAQGHVPSMMTLGTILAEGRKFPHNPYKAHILFNLASVHGADNAAEYRDKISHNMKIENVLQAQAQADAYRAAPSELTQYIRQTFGDNLTAYIDRYLSKDSLEAKEDKKIIKNTRSKTGLL